MKNYTFTVTHETKERYTVYWKDGTGTDEISKDFMTEQEARKFAENLLHDEKILTEPWCEYRRIVDLTTPINTFGRH